MNIREMLENKERDTLSAQACLSCETKGRGRQEPEHSCRTVFQRDRDRIIHSKAFRRLKDKTQVFMAAVGDHYRTRLTHTLEVSQIARTIARALEVNEDLTEAIALGHDLGHTPFGHAGESVLEELSPFGFAHNEQSLRVVDILERNGGLNLTFEVRDGIVNHSKGRENILAQGRTQLPATLEGDIVRICDGIAYINHDIDDAVRADIISIGDLPHDAIKLLGERQSDRINAMAEDIIHNTKGGSVVMSERVLQATNDLRNHLYGEVYPCEAIQTEISKGKRLLTAIYRHVKDHPEELPAAIPGEEDDIERRAVDFVAGMTDRYALAFHEEKFLPSTRRL
ncbi:deoxyguanosinetriphosphate triphosphohydrolase [Candidatus Hydrogenedentota bacterium]